MSGKHDRHGQHRYGSVHKAARKRFAARMKAGEVFNCWRCGEPIDPRRWDLGHVDPELHRQFGTSFPEHPACNRATYAHLKQRLGQAPQTPKPRFDGLPDPTPGNTADRWSRHWDSGRFNPRCPECRKRRAMCDFALELVRKDSERAE